MAKEDNKMLLVNRIFELKTILECNENSVKDARDLALSFMNLVSHQESPKTSQEKYMVDQLITEQLKVLICGFKFNESGVKETILNVLF